MKIVVPEDVEYIIDTLMDNGYEAYAVGGCVRDTILNREPDDWDITTSAAPEQVKGLFRRTLDTGIQHGTVTVMLGRNGYEVTTYRIDGIYTDGRHPESVSFTASLEEDLKRRDFTINAMAYNHKTGLVDIFGGADDIKRCRICCVGNPTDRFTEDALRILRAVRFSAQLGFDIEEKTREAVADLAPNLEKVSTERIQTELSKLLVSPHPEYFRILYETGITALLLPEFDQMMKIPQKNVSHCYDVGCHTLKTLEYTPKDKALRWAALLHDCGKIITHEKGEDGGDYFPNHAEAGAPLAEAVLKRFKLDNYTIRRVKQLVYWHSYRFQMDKYSVRWLLSRVEPEFFPDLLALMRADSRAKSEAAKALRLSQLEQVEAFYKEILADDECISLKMLAVSGSDLIEAGVSPGKQVGDILDRLLEEVLEKPSLNTKEQLLKRI